MWLGHGPCVAQRHLTKMLSTSQHIKPGLMLRNLRTADNMKVTTSLGLQSTSSTVEQPGTIVHSKTRHQIVSVGISHTNIACKTCLGHYPMRQVISQYKSPQWRGMIHKLPSRAFPRPKPGKPFRLLNPSTPNPECQKRKT